MAVKIKLKRLGKMRAPQYRLVVADARAKRDGRAIEEIGTYRPTEDPSFIEVDSDRVQYWLGVGAQPTEPVLAILKVTGDWQRFKGLPGAEGTLRVAEAKPDKAAVFEAAAKDAGGEPELAPATTPKARKTAPEATAGIEAGPTEPETPEASAPAEDAAAATEDAAAETADESA